MCEMDNRGGSDRRSRSYRGQDPARIRNKSEENLLKDEFETSSRSTPGSPVSQQRGVSVSFVKCQSEPEFVENRDERRSSIVAGSSSPSVSRVDKTPNNYIQFGVNASAKGSGFVDDDPFVKELAAKMSATSIATSTNEVVFNGTNANESDNCTKVGNGKDMAPVLGVPPPPPAPHMGPDGLILPRKLNNPYLESKNHKDLHRELIFNAKVGRNVLNQKSELDRALEKQRVAASRKEAERLREESFKDDPRTVLQRAIEQRARHIRLAEQPQNEEPPNPLVTARAKLRTRTDSQ